MALLLIFDDGRDRGALVRLTKDRYCIGRDTEICIPHDPAIAAEHVEIHRIQQSTGYAWQLTDLDSQTGLWVRVRRVKLRDGCEFIAGNHRYAYSPGIDDDRSGCGTTVLNQRLAAGSLPGQSIFDSSIAYPSIQRLGDPVSKPLWLISGSYWIGSNTKCELSCPQDPFLAGQHVNVSQEQGEWTLDSHGVRNGLWLRQPRIQVTKTCTFQIGEQRFRLYAAV